jgi:hypothetical protein
VGLGAVLGVIAILTASGLGSYVAVQNGYVPVKVLADINPELSSLKAVVPPGNATELSLEDILDRYPEIAETLATEVPHYNELIVKIYSTGEALDDVGAFYNSWLTAKGFTCIKSGYMQIGNLDEGILPIYYYGYQKGITGVGLVMTDYRPGESFVVYTTGYSSYYGDIITWLEEQRIHT